MSLDQLISYCYGETKAEAKRTSRDIRREKVETAVKRLDAAIAMSHEKGEALRESYREAAESSKRVIECLICPRRASASGANLP